jgi:hypothetical protein
MLIMGELLCLAIKLVEPTTIGADPEDPRPACVKGTHIIMTQAVGVARHVAIVVKGLSTAIMNANATICSYPEHSVPALINLVNITAAQAVWIGGVMYVVKKGRCFPIESIQSAPPRANPKLTCLVYKNRFGNIVAQSLRIGRIMLIASESDRFRIEFAEPIVRADPQDARMDWGRTTLKC